MKQKLLRIAFLLGVMTLARSRPVLAGCEDFYSWVDAHCTNVCYLGCDSTGPQGQEFREGSYEGCNHGEVYCS